MEARECQMVLWVFSAVCVCVENCKCLCVSGGRLATTLLPYFVKESGMNNVSNGNMRVHGSAARHRPVPQ